MGLDSLSAVDFVEALRSDLSLPLLPITLAFECRTPRQMAHSPSPPRPGETEGASPCSPGGVAPRLAPAPGPGPDAAAAAYWRQRRLALATSHGPGGDSVRPNGPGQRLHSDDKPWRYGWSSKYKFNFWFFKL